MPHTAAPGRRGFRHPGERDPWCPLALGDIPPPGPRGEQVRLCLCSGVGGPGLSPCPVAPQSRELAKLEDIELQLKKAAEKLRELRRG